MSNNENQPKIENELVPEQPVAEPVVKTRKAKVYVKKGNDSRGRPAMEGKTTEYGLPADPDYYKKYYAEKLAVKVQCETCLMFVAKVNLKKHANSSYHKRFCQAVQDNATINV